MNGYIIRSKHKDKCWIWKSEDLKIVNDKSSQKCSIQLSRIPNQNGFKSFMLSFLLSGFVFFTSVQRVLVEFCEADSYTDGCSVPFGLDTPFKEIFTKACNKHDTCYGCVSQIISYSFQTLFVVIKLYSFLLKQSCCFTPHLSPPSHVIPPPPPNHRLACGNKGKYCTE